MSEEPYSEKIKSLEKQLLEHSSNSPEYQKILHELEYIKALLERVSGER